MPNAELVHPLMQQRGGLVKRAFKEGQVILLAVMVGNAAGHLVRGGVADVGQSAFNLITPETSTFQPCRVYNRAANRV